MKAVVLAFVSGKGGTGKSTTSVFVGAALARLGKKVLLLELDYGLRSVDIITGVSGRAIYDLEDVLLGRCEPYKAVIESPLYKGLSVITAPYSGGSVTPAGLQLLCNKMRGYFDFIIIDTAAGLTEPYQAAVSVSRRVVMVLTADPIALRDGRKIADELDGTGALCRLILSRVDAEQLRRSGVLQDLDEAIDMVGVQLLGVVPESPVISKAALTGTPLPRQSKENEVYTAIARRITGLETPLVFDE